MYIVLICTERTRLTHKPVSVHLEFFETYAEFVSAVTGDDSTPVTIEWYRVGSRSPVANKTGRVNVTVSQDGTTLSFEVTANDTEGWARVVGNYQCRASNGYSGETANFSLSIDPLPLAPSDGTTPASNHILYTCSFVE